MFLAHSREPEKFSFFAIFIFSLCSILNFFHTRFEMITKNWLLKIDILKFKHNFHFVTHFAAQLNKIKLFSAFLKLLKIKSSVYRPTIVATTARRKNFHEKLWDFFSACARDDRKIIFQFMVREEKF